MPDLKCITILSEKSSGSSVCQNLLATFSDIKHVAKTRHYQNETLYWTKAASILKLPQIHMLDSEVPISSGKARKDLVTLLTENLENYSPPDDDRELIFGGWRLLCNAHRPIFLEKSPHHLVQWTAIELILDFMKMYPDIDFLFIGLIRNPMATIYSQFKRWKTRPESLQHQWITAYKNLLRLKDKLGEQVIIVRYEDIATSIDAFQPVFDFCNVRCEVVDRNYIHRRSISKWKNDRSFGFRLSEEGVALACEYGYKPEDLMNANASYPMWPAYREMARATYKVRIIARGIARKTFIDTKPMTNI
jgi:hypothetical protein